jgi:hypothetical protein
MLLTCILEEKVPNLNVGCDTDCPEVFHGFPLTLEANTRMAPLNVMATFSPALSSSLDALVPII